MPKAKSFIISLFILGGLFLFKPLQVLAADPTCGGDSQVCCNPGELCNNGFTCNDRTFVCDKSTNPTTCGASGLPCCSGLVCNSGLTCSTNNYACETTTPLPTTCGSRGQACCSGYICKSGLACDNRTFVCGGITGGISAGDPTCTINGKSGIDSAIGCIPVENLSDFAGFLLKWGVGIGGGIAFILIVISGFMIMTASGNPEKLQAGKELMTSAIMGLIMLIFSVFLLKIIGVDILRLPGIT